MSHLDEGTLHAVLDGEVSAIELTTIEQHLAACRECQQRMAEARGFRTEAFALVESLDAAPPVAATALALAAAPIPVAASREATVTPIRRRPRWVLPVAWAATLILAAGLGSAISWRQAAPIVESLPPGDALVVGGEYREQPAPLTSQDTTAEGESAPKAKQRVASYRPKEPSSRTVPTTTATTATAPNAATPSPEPARQGAVAELADARKATQAPERADQGRERDSAGPAAAPALALNEAKDEAARRTAPAAALSRRAEETDLGRGGAAANSLRKELLRLDRPAPPNPADQRIRVISAVAAIRALGGSLRLVDGLEPIRFELVGEVVRVVYRTDWGLVTLEQWRAGELLAYELSTPTGTPADSVLAWERRIR